MRFVDAVARRQQRLRSGRRRWRHALARGTGAASRWTAALIYRAEGAVIFDLPVGGWECRPTRPISAVGANAAAGVDVAVGTVGVGLGARRALQGRCQDCIGYPAVIVTVGVLAVVNAAGNVIDQPPACRGWPTCVVGGFALRAAGR